MKKILFLLVLSFVSCTSEPVDNSIDISTDTTEYAYSEEELNLMSMINDYREGIGENRLKSNGYISKLCYEHNMDMISVNTASHSGFKDRSDNILNMFKLKRLGENVAYGYNSNASVLNAWLLSDGHRKNIEGDFTYFGLSIREDSKGKKYYTNIFVK